MRASALLCLLGAVSAVSIGATPRGEPVTPLDGAIVGAASNWTDAETTGVPELDEQIFTDVSPLIESADAVRLPEDPAPSRPDEAEETQR